LGKAYTYLRMLFALLIALGVQSVVGQCGLQLACSDCMNMGGCAWNLGVCIDMSTMLTGCVAPACVNVALNCPAVLVVIYPTTAPLYTTPVSSVLPPLSTSASIYASPSIYASAALPASSTIYGSTFLPASSSLYPAVSSTLYPTTLSASVWPTVSSSLYPSTILPASTPIYGSTYLNGNVVYNGGVYSGVNAGVGLNGGLGGGLLNYNGNVVNANLRNTVEAGALAPYIPGIGGTVSALNSVNLLANGGQEFNNILNGGGGRGNALNGYLRGSLFANSIGGMNAGLGADLGQINQLNLLSSLF